MKLVHVPPTFIDLAWTQGASSLEEACNEECTIDQLKMTLSRGEKQLFRFNDSEGNPVGWMVCFAVNYPNFRALSITNLVAHNTKMWDYTDQLKALAASMGCSRIRCCAKPAQARLYRMKMGFEPVYETLEISLT